MTIQRSFQLLDLSPESTLEEAKQAYKDAVSVWHPDRFGHNPRLRRKCEQRLKEINQAYREVKAFLLSNRDRSEGPGHRASADGPAPGAVRPVAEVIAEAGTRLVLGLWAVLSEVVGHGAAGPSASSEKERRRTVRRAPAGDE